MHESDARRLAFGTAANSADESTRSSASWATANGSHAALTLPAGLCVSSPSPSSPIDELVARAASDASGSTTTSGSAVKIIDVQRRGRPLNLDLSNSVANDDDDEDDRR